MSWDKLIDFLKSFLPEKLPVGKDFKQEYWQDVKKEKIFYIVSSE